MVPTGTNPPPRIAIVYESMFGNTRRIAEAIGRGMMAQVPVEILPVAKAEDWAGYPEVLILGAPTHAHGLSRPSTREEAVRWARDSHRRLEMDSESSGPGMREWLDSSDPAVVMFATFDTRVDMPRIFTGSAAVAIDKRLRSQGASQLIAPESFFVDRENELDGGQIERAEEWGREVGELLAHSQPVVAQH